MIASNGIGTLYRLVTVSLPVTLWKASALLFIVFYNVRNGEWCRFDGRGRVPQLELSLAGAGLELVTVESSSMNATIYFRLPKCDSVLTGELIAVDTFLHCAVGGWLSTLHWDWGLSLVVLRPGWRACVQPHLRQGRDDWSPPSNPSILN